MKDYKFETQCVHGEYYATNGEPQVIPIVQNTTYRYHDANEVAKLFDLESDKFMYSRLGNPTVGHLEQQMALIEGGTAACATSSGQAATLLTVLNVCQAGDEIICSSSVYGGTYNLLNVSLRKLGINTIFVDEKASTKEILKLTGPKTKLIIGETISNPTLCVLDFEKFSNIAKKLNILFVVDNTLASSYICKPFDFGADIVIYSTTKYSDGHANSVGGMVIEKGDFDYNKSGKYPTLTEKDPSYHGLVFYEKFQQQAFTVRMRAVVLRDFGACMAPMNAFLTHQGIQTLNLRMEKHSSNALKLAKYLETSPLVESVNYPFLESSKEYGLAQKYLKLGSGVICFVLKGGKKAGEVFQSSLKLTSVVVHVGDIRTSVLHPSSTTHRQLSESEQIAAGINPGLIRVSVGIENIDDIIQDFANALKEVSKCQ